ncbi:MAG: Uma2 family endonuclease [Arcicella sp.]|jgi:Uma2 family endonuclease|nr:Uma2 family endonuclease [Arcicella sp.]
MKELLVQKQLFTVEEYMNMELHADYKHEYHDGEIITMPGGTINHSKIGLNVATTLKFRQKGKSCKPFNSDMAIAINDFRYVYPDVSVVCGEPIMGILNKNSIQNPTLIIEVLSEGTASYDSGDKFRKYREIKTLKEYVLIDQESFLVEVFSKLEDNHWDLRVFNQANNIIPLKSIDTEISMQEIYEEVDFEVKN